MINDENSLVLEVNQKLTTIGWKFSLQEKDIKNYSILDFYGFKTFLKLCKEKAGQGSIQLIESQNKELLRILIPIEIKTIEFELQRKKQDLASSLNQVFDDLSSLNRQMSSFASKDFEREQQENVIQELKNEI